MKKDNTLMNKLLETAASLGWKMETTDVGTNEMLIGFVKPSPLGIDYTLYLKAQEMATPELFLHSVRTQAFEFNLHTYMIELSTWTGFGEKQTVGAHIDDCFAVQQSVSTLSKELQAVYDNYVSKPLVSPSITLTDAGGNQLQLCYDQEKHWTMVTLLSADGSVESRHRIEDQDFSHLLKDFLNRKETIEV